MTFNNNASKKLIACLLIIGVLSPAFIIFSIPKQTLAIGAPVVDITLIGKSIIEWLRLILKEIIKQFLMMIARKLIDKMTQATINWVNSGFKGKPLFIENPGSFFKDIIKTEVKGFVGDIGYNKIKFPFGKDYALGVIEQAKSAFQTNASYSLSKVYSESEAEYQKQNFSAGGWNGFLLNTQFPQNNFMGFDLLASNELAERLTGPNSETQKVKDKVQQGLGFLSQQKCKSNPTWSPEKLADGPGREEEPNIVAPIPRTCSGFNQAQCKAQNEADWKAYEKKYNEAKEAAAVQFKQAYSCPEGPATVTPGSLISDQIMNAVGSKQRQGELGAALGNALAAIFDALINKLFDAGLTALSKAITPAEKPENTSMDDFNYYGSTSGGFLGNPPTNPEAKLTVSTSIVNNDGGILDSGSVMIYVDSDPLVPGATGTYSAGTHTVSGSAPGYTSSVSGDCALDGSITLVAGITKSCTVTFDDIAGAGGGGSGGGGGGGPIGPKLTVRKIVINDNSGTSVVGDFDLFVDGQPVMSGVEYTYAGGTHVVSEALVPGYTGTIGGDCGSDGSVFLARDSVRECTITNDDN